MSFRGLGFNSAMIALIAMGGFGGGAETYRAFRTLGNGGEASYYRHGKTHWKACQRASKKKRRK